MVEEVVLQAQPSAAYYGGDGPTLCAAIAVLATARCCQLRLPSGGPARAAAALGLVSVLLALPWRIRHYHLRALTAFACFWTCPSKLLLLLCSDRPLDYLPPSSGFLYFALVCTLPVRASSSASAMKASSSSPSLPSSSPSSPSSSSSVMIHYPFIAASAKLLAFISILNLYSFRPYLSFSVIYALYCLHIYLGIELIFGSIATLLSVLFRVHCDPPSRNPLLSPSLSEFWGRRWNIVVTATLRATVYNPILYWLISTGDRRALSCHGSTRNSNPGHGIDPTNYSGNSSHGSIISRHGDSISSRGISCSDQMDNHGISNSDHINNNSVISSHGGSISSHGTSNSGRIPSHDSNNSDHINNNSSHVDGNPSRDREHVSTVFLKGSEVVASRTPNGNSNQLANQKPPLMARAIATMATFLVSGVLHELIFLCVNNGDITQATGEVTAFFFLHGLATCAEICLRRAWPSQLRVPWIISVALTMGFLYFTAVWLFLPPLTRGGADLHTIAEYHQLQEAIVALVRESIKR